MKKFVGIQFVGWTELNPKVPMVERVKKARGLYEERFQEPCNVVAMHPDSAIVVEDIDVEIVRSVPVGGVWAGRREG